MNQNIEFQGQFGEDKIIYNYFKETYGESFKGSILDIGANDGKTISNSYAFIQEGWTGSLIEPGRIPYAMLEKQYDNDSSVDIFNFAISETDGTVEFFESFSNDPWSQNGLVSSIIETETEYWKTRFGVSYEKYEVESLTYDSFIKKFYNDDKVWDFISIDVEGADFSILKQIDLTKCKCKCLIVEYNKKNPEQFINYCRTHNMHILYFNDCNLVFVTNT